MNRTDAIGVGMVGAAIAGAVAIGVALRPGPAPTLPDGGAPPPPVVVYALPDGGGWPVAPDAGVFFIGIPPSTVGQVDVVTPTGYERVTYALLGDGGVLLGTTPLPFTCACASDAGACLFSDGGQVPLTGSYAASAVSGPGCQLRPCTELAGWTGAPGGCAP